MPETNKNITKLLIITSTTLLTVDFESINTTATDNIAQLLQ